jgi:hypothetical protein
MCVFILTHIPCTAYCITGLAVCQSAYRLCCHGETYCNVFIFSKTAYVGIVVAVGLYGRLYYLNLWRLLSSKDLYSSLLDSEQMPPSGLAVATNSRGGGRCSWPRFQSVVGWWRSPITGRYLVTDQLNVKSGPKFRRAMLLAHDDSCTWCARVFEAGVYRRLGNTSPHIQEVPCSSIGPWAAYYEWRFSLLS